MNTIKNFLIEVYAVSFTVLLTLVFSVFALTISALGASISTMRHWVVYPWSRGFMFFGRVKTFELGRENLDLSRPMVWMTNHRSLYDTPLILMHEPVFLVFIGKRAIRNVPIFGTVVEKVGMLFVDRGDPEKSRASLDEAARQIHSGRHVLVFPEGSRSKPGGDLLPFKKGGFHLTLAAGVPIQPIVVLGTENILAPGSRRVHSGTATLRYGKPIALHEGETAESLLERTRTAMQELIDLGEAG